MLVGLLLQVAGTAEPTLTVQQQLHAIGVQGCTQVLAAARTSQRAHDVDGSDFLARIDSLGLHPEVYCHCVGNEFADDDAQQLDNLTGAQCEQALQIQLVMNMTLCTPGPASELQLDDSEAVAPPAPPADD